MRSGETLDEINAISMRDHWLPPRSTAPMCVFVCVRVCTLNIRNMHSKLTHDVIQ